MIFCRFYNLGYNIPSVFGRQRVTTRGTVLDGLAGGFDPRTTRFPQEIRPKTGDLAVPLLLETSAPVLSSSFFAQDEPARLGLGLREEGEAAEKLACAPLPALAVEAFAREHRGRWTRFPAFANIYNSGKIAGEFLKLLSE